jgi:hypothetical protein
VAGLALAVAAAAGGCGLSAITSSGGDGSHDIVDSQGSAPLGGGTTLGDGVAGDAYQGLPELPVPDVTWDAAAAEAARATATAAVAAFARPAATPEQWWAALAPMLSPAARSAYAATDPANVPASTVTGPAGEARSSSAFLATVTVPTDAGVYTVLLVRDDTGDRWLVERFRPPPDDPATPAPP